MRRIFTIIIVVLVLGGLITLAIFKPEVFKDIWLWIVGLFGLILTGIKRFIEFLSPGRSIKDIEESNEDIKRENEKIKKELEEANAKLARERIKHREEIERITTQVEEQEKVYEEIKGRLHMLQEMGYQKYIESLPSSERKKLEDELFKEIDFY